MESNLFYTISRPFEGNKGEQDLGAKSGKRVDPSVMPDKGCLRVWPSLTLYSSTFLCFALINDIMILLFFYLAGFIADRLNSYKPSFILCAAVEFVGAVILLFVICGHRKPFHTQPVLEEVPLGDEFSGDHCKLDDTKRVTELQP